ncbi:hypothetical protein Tco_0044546 [Tanacetum coccineum]
MNHQTSSVPLIAYQSPQVSIQPMTVSPLMDSGFAVPVVSLVDDLIACLNMAMAFLIVVASSRFPSTNNQLRTSLNLRNHATIQDGRTEDLDTYDSDYDDISNAKAVLRANISNYGSDVILEVPHSETYLNDMENQSVHAMHDFEQSPVVDFTDNDIHITAELERYKERVKTFKQRLNIDLSSREKMIDSQMDDMIKEKLAQKEQVDSLEQNHSKQIKEKECLLQTFTVFKNESKEKENKCMENEIDLEKKIMKLDNFIFKVDQSAQTVHILTEDFGKRSTQQQELSVEQAFWLRISNPTIKPSNKPPVIVEVPSELPKVSLVNASLKKLKFHLAQFDSVVKKRITPDVRTEDTCPNAIKLSGKKVAVTPKNDVKKVRFAEPLTSSSNIKLVESSTTSDSNTPVLSPIGLKCSTSNYRSKPTGNKKNDRISRTSSRNMKNKVEAQPMKVNKKNRIVEPIRDVDVKHSLLKANFELICATCKNSMFDGVHDMCLLDFVENVNSHAKSAKKHKKQNIWKPTGHVFTEV